MMAILGVNRSKRSHCLWHRRRSSPVCTASPTLWLIRPDCASITLRVPDATPPLRHAWPCHNVQPASIPLVDNELRSA